MPRKIKHSGDFDQATLEKSLRRVEAGKGALLTIEAYKGDTYSTHDWEIDVPLRSLVLVLDPDGTAKGPDGSTLIVRGAAVIDGDEKKVACFREAGEDAAADEGDAEEEEADPA